MSSAVGSSGSAEQVIAQEPRLSRSTGPRRCRTAVRARAASRKPGLTGEHVPAVVVHDTMRTRPAGKRHCPGCWSRRRTSGRRPSRRAERCADPGRTGVPLRCRRRRTRPRCRHRRRTRTAHRGREHRSTRPRSRRRRSHPIRRPHGHLDAALSGERRQVGDAEVVRRDRLGLPPVQREPGGALAQRVFDVRRVVGKAKERDRRILVEVGQVVVLGERAPARHAGSRHRSRGRRPRGPGERCRTRPRIPRPRPSSRGSARRRTRPARRTRSGRPSTTGPPSVK